MRTFICPPSRPRGSQRKMDWLLKPGRPSRQSVRTTGHQCPQCRRWFFGNHMDQTFCTVACWLVWLREHARRAICPACHQKFNPRPTGRGTLQRCCSRRCAGLSARGPSNRHWKHGRYAKPILAPSEIIPEAPTRKRFMRQKPVPSVHNRDNSAALMPTGRDTPIPS
jgi:hypothetical protein